jgi:hypothetical protein
MAFNVKRVKAYSQGAQTAYVAPLAAFKGSQIALSTLVAGTTASTAGLVLSMASSEVEWDSLSALVETDITTNTITVAGKWQGSLDGTNWLDILPNNPAAAAGTLALPQLQRAAAGTGSLITTQYLHQFPGVNPAYDYIRFAVLVGVVTGAAGDNVTVSYCYRKRTPTLA